MRLAQDTTRIARRAFTLIELLFVLLILAILIGILLVAFRGAIGGARSATTRQSVLALTSAIEQFKRDFDTLPPMVKDGFQGTPDTTGPLLTLGRGRQVPNVYNFGDPTDREFLQGQSGDPEYRFSIYSLPYYLMGALGKDVDGVEGPGALEPQRDGTFDRLSNRRYEPLFDPKRGGLNSVDPSEGRIELVDGNGVSFRYYRWIPVGQGDQGYDDGDPIGNLAIPDIVGNAAENTELRSASYAIVSAGADGLFGTLGVRSYPGQSQDIEDKYMVEVELGKRFETDAAAAEAARRDNVVEVGTDD